MAKETTKINWQNIISLYNSYESKMADFCQKHGITRNQLYYHKKRQNRNDSISFLPIKLNSKDSLDLSNKKASTNTSIIKISIGKADIHIPACEKVLLIDILKELL
ncbi:IS66 family insertion sequence element accessory protein TnpA [Tepidibacter mesophilus]|uniref:IS66 family insertion sequence element accessory protein TnpA n=1 Tax=Tepidibacter mesophilus TaxID=655607 RepID=UPI000C07C564|nr:hypothetical protein [Tepidibacter mesophilus]